MSDTARAGEAGYWARRAQWAREQRVLSGYVRPPRRQPTARELDPARRPDTVGEALERAQWLADETPGLDEAHCIPGHPNYTGGSR